MSLSSARLPLPLAGEADEGAGERGDTGMSPFNSRSEASNLSYENVNERDRVDGDDATRRDRIKSIAQIK